MKNGEAQVDCAMQQQHVNAVSEDKEMSLSTEYKISEPIPVEYGSCEKSDGEQQKKIIGKHEKLHHHVIVRECANCSILSEKNDFCFNLLEKKLGHRGDIHLERERIVGEKGQLQYFGKALENCSKCGNLQIHSLFTKNNENSSLRLNLGGFSPVLLHNIFKTCESKGSDIECRLVILGARPRSSPAYAFLSEHSKPCSTYCQHCRYQSPNSHRSHHPQGFYSANQLFDYCTPATNGTSDPHQSNAVSSSISSQAPLVLDTVDDSNFPVLPPNYLCFPTSIQRISPYSQHSAISNVHSIFKSSSCENPREVLTTASQSGAQNVRRKSPFVVDIATSSCEARRYAASPKWDELTRGNSSAMFHIGKARYDGEVSSISSSDSRLVSSGKEVDTRTQNKRLLNPVDESEFASPAKKYPVTCKVSSAHNVQGVNFSDASNIPQSMSLTHPQSSLSEAIVKVDGTNITKSMPVTEITLVEESSKPSNILGLSVASQASKDTTQATETTTSGLIQAFPTSGEYQLRITNVWSSQKCSPKYDSTFEAQQGKSADLQETEVMHLSEKSGVNIVDSKAGREKKTDVSHWSNEDVMSFLKGAECGEYAEIFRQEDIDGQALLLLNEERLHSLLGIKMGPAMKIARHIRNLQASLSHETENIASK